jgi:hypothetical protein
LRGVSKDRPQALVAHPSRLAARGGEHLRMTTEIFAWDKLVYYYLAPHVATLMAGY